MLSFYFLCGVLIITIFYAINILREYERGVVFFLGRFWNVKGPGLIIIIPILQEMIRIDLRTVVMDVPAQDLISKDNVSIKVNAVVYFHVEKPELAVIKVENYLNATSQLAQTSLRSILGEHELDELLSQRESLNKTIKEILDKQTDSWGIKVTHVEIKDIDINETMVRAIAKQAEAERERRAKIIHSEGELQAAKQLMEAAKTLAQQPEAMRLRTLQTLSDIASDKTSTIVFPVELISKLITKD